MVTVAMIISGICVTLFSENVPKIVEATIEIQQKVGLTD